MNKKKYVNRNYLTTTRIIALGFLITVIVGTILLSLPIASANGTWTDLLTAAFTSTTSVCVTDINFDPDRRTRNRFDHHTVYVVIKNEDNLEKYNAVAGCI